MPSLDSLKTRKKLTVGKSSYDYFSLKAAEKELGDLSLLPVSLKVLLENLLRNENGTTVTVDDIKAVAQWLKDKKSDREIAFRPARVLMQDFTGVPAVVDLAAMRDAMASMGGDPNKINPLSPVDLVIDHSVIVDEFGSKAAFKDNVKLEYERNAERYGFLRWGQQAFNNFRVVPPGTGICHQVNLEYLAQTVWTAKEGRVNVAYPDTLVGTDSHTTMVNGLAVLGWGVGGIEAEAAMLGQPISMLIPEVVGFKLKGKLKEGTTATDLVLTVTQMLRKHGVVGKFVEFYGPGLDQLSLADRATIANMAPEYGATCGFFPIDAETINFLKSTGRKPGRVALVEEYAKANGLWRTARSKDPVFSSTLELDISSVEPSLAGPRRPQDRVPLSGIAENFMAELVKPKPGFDKAGKESQPVKVASGKYEVDHGHVTIAAITSCTNTSNPSVMLGAGLLAQKAVALGLKVKPWVKTSLAPGSKVVTDYLAKAGVDKALDKLGFNLVGYGCTTCIGNSGPLPEEVADAVTKGDLVAGAVISGNRNFEGRVNPLVKANYLGSPMLVVAYAIAGSLKIDLTKDPIGTGKGGKPVYLKDIWPTNEEITETVRKCVTASQFRAQYKDVFGGDTNWKKVKTTESQTYAWDNKSTYIQNPPYFDKMPATPKAVSEVTGARILAIFADSITTDHISPAGNIKKDSPAGKYLVKNKVDQADFNQYGARRGNHEVMMRGTFANIRIKNELVPGTEGGVTKYFGKPGETIAEPKTEAIYDASMKYQKAGVPLIVVAGKEYGTGSSRDWAAKGTNLLGVKAVIAESFERIHRSNLVGMGVLPLVFKDGADRKSIGFEGTDVIDLVGFAENLTPRMDVTCRITKADGTVKEIPLLLRIDTVDEVGYFKNGGILQYVLRGLLAA
ncbi:aconitate hydratase AcnA [Zavarzinia aquatilis]|uniref:Aconitate hydratase n=1 Tax=Zavarzinia aquatilis TaxID=2211142 RepID=A0A317DZS2_9PROT|nr:aconitate hydratase AcnA [Zavarzinia aquatilis]PWR20308.1 aconitate hydratase AcnA [Zavarzinia aquatilis]